MFLFTDYFSIKSKYCKRLKKYPENEAPPDILYINRLEVLSPYRGRKLGEALISNTIRIMGRNGDLVALQAFPLQLYKYIQKPSTEDPWKVALNLSAFPSDDETARKKLNNYYRKLGFKKLNKENLMYLIV